MKLKGESCQGCLVPEFLWKQSPSHPADKRYIFIFPPRKDSCFQFTFVFLQNQFVYISVWHNVPVFMKYEFCSSNIVCIQCSLRLYQHPVQSFFFPPSDTLCPDHLHDVIFEQTLSQNSISKPYKNYFFFARIEKQYLPRWSSHHSWVDESAPLLQICRK